MAKKTLNVAMIGTQFMGKAHSNAWSKLPMFFDLPVDVVMKVVCGQSLSGLKTAQTWGWQEISQDWKAVVRRPDIDLIDICTPNFLHPAIALEAAKQGKHILCEKPLASTLKDAETMAAAVKKAQGKHMCAFSYRFAPAVATIKNMVASGKLGRLFHFRAHYQQDWIVDPAFPLNWRLQKKVAGAGSLGDIGAHIIDMCHYLVGPISEVCASMRTFVKERPIAEGAATIAATKGHKKSSKMGKVDVDDAAIFLAHIKGSDALCTFEATRFAPGRRNYNGFELYGSKGGVIWNVEDMNYFQYYDCADPETAQGFRRVHASDGAHPYANHWWPTGHTIGYEHMFVHEIYEFVQNLSKKATPYPTFADGLACQKVIAAVEKASKTRRWERV